MKRAEVWHDRGWRGDLKPWTVLIHENGVIPDRSRPILYRDSSDEGHTAFPHARGGSRARPSRGRPGPARRAPGGTVTRCEHLVFGYSPCTRRNGHTGPHHGHITTEKGQDR